MSENEILIHLHMPKTAGTTLKHIIKKNIPPSVNFDIYEDLQQRKKKLIALSKKHVTCIQGHFPFGVHQYFTNPCTYITMLREPTDRIISQYYFIRSRPKHTQYQKVSRMSLEEYQLQPENINQQTRFISGQVESPITLLDLEQAKENIEKYFSFVGITEMFNESLFLLQKRFSWNNITYTKQNVTKNRPPIDQLPVNILHLIKENNEFDLELYHYAKQLLIEQINNLDSVSKEGFHVFLEKN
ncbi:sulfotransferase family 2 domain-containing protein [Halalkalibacter lacteus]|uniref:sulfotransferase family 2 domain-containing protein n=1 Tax=Halalkalibacter lacteus TaxID=3090663 RepID=UPI002FC9528F